MSVTQFIAAMLYVAIADAFPEYLEPDDEGNLTPAFVVRCELYFIAARCDCARCVAAEGQ